MIEPAASGRANGNSLGMRWGDKGVNANGPLALVVLLLLVFGAGIGYAVYWAGSEIRAAGVAIVKSNTDGFADIKSVLKSVAEGQKAMTDKVESRQSIANCLTAYDFTARKRIRERAENGTLNLDAWCRWMDVLNEASKEKR